MSKYKKNKKKEDVKLKVDEQQEYQNFIDNDEYFDMDDKHHDPPPSASLDFNENSKIVDIHQDPPLNASINFFENIEMVVAHHDPPINESINMEENSKLVKLHQDPSSKESLVFDKNKITEKITYNNSLGNKNDFKVSTSIESKDHFDRKFLNKNECLAIQHKNLFAFYHTQTILSQYVLRRINNEIYQYIDKYGYYKLLNDNALKTLIRSGYDIEIQCRLSRLEVADIVERIQTEPTICVSADNFDKNEYLVNFLNGTLDLQSFILLPHSPDYNLTTLIQANYTPDYKLNGVFADFLNEITENNKNKALHIQEITGYNLSSFTGIKKATVFDGVRHSGKSTYERMIQGLLGFENISNFSLSALNNRFTLGKLLTKKVNLCGERGAAVLKDIETFKAITGGDWSEAENKGQDFISRPAKCKFIFAGNMLPTFINPDDAESFMDRITLFIFAHTIREEHRIKDMDKCLLEERDLIVSWAMDGLKKLIDNNFRFHEADDAIAIRNSRISQVNSIEDFINECCEIKTGLKVFSKDLYNRYLKYSRMNALDAIKQAEFIGEIIAKTERMSPIHKKIRIGKNGPYYGFENLGLKENELSDTDGTTEQYL